MIIRIFSACMAVVISAAAFWISTGCNGSGKPQTIEQAFLDYDEIDLVTFTISGTARCEVCVNDGIPIVGMQIEVVPKGDPMHVLATRVFDGIGPFTISGLKAVRDTDVEVLGTLYREGTSGAIPMGGYAEVDVPDENDGVVSVLLKFPSRAED